MKHSEIIAITFLHVRQDPLGWMNVQISDLRRDSAPVPHSLDGVQRCRLCEVGAVLHGGPAVCAKWL